MANQNPQIPGTPEPSATSEGLAPQYNNNRITPDNAGIGNQLANAATNVGNTTAQIAQQQQAIADKAKGEADMTAAVAAQTSFIRSSQKQLYGDGTDAHPGFLSLEGAKAVPASKQTIDGMEEARQTLRGTLSNDEQKTAFDKLTIPHATSYQEQIESYTQRQVKAAHQATYNASTDNSLQAISNAARIGDVDSVEDAIQRQRVIVAAEARTRGVDKIPDPQNPGQMIDSPSIQAMQASWRKQATVAALQGFMASDNGDDDHSNALTAHIAQNFLNDHKDDLGPELKQWTDAVTGLKKHVDVSVDTNNLLNDAKDKTTGAIDWAKVQTGLNKMPENDHKYAVLELATRRAADNAKFVDQQGAVLANKIMAKGDPKNIGRFRMPTDPEAQQWRAQLNAIDPKALVNLDALQMREDRAALLQERMLKNVATAQEKAEAATTKAASTTASASARVDLADHPDRYAGMTAEAYQRLLNDPTQFGPMSAPDQKKAVDKFLEVQNKNPGRLNDQLVTDVMQSVGIKSKDKKAALLSPLSDSVQRWMDAERAKGTGHTPTETDIREQIKQRLAKGDVTGGGTLYGDKNDIYEIEYEQGAKPGGDYVGKPFVPKNAAGVAPTEPVAKKPAPKPASAPPAPSNADTQRAIEWLQNNQSDPNAAAVEARLRKMGAL